MDANLTELNNRFGIPGLQFTCGAGGFERAVVESPVANGELYLHGAHVTRFQPQGHAPVLWMSDSSYFEVGKPIRGGVPICFPWFGPNAKDPQAPAHGSARTSAWDVAASSRLVDGGVAIELAVIVDGLSLRYRVEFGRMLQLSLSVEWEQASTSLCPSTPASGLTKMPENGVFREIRESEIHTNYRSLLPGTPGRRAGDEGALLPSDSAPHPPTPSPQKTGARGENESRVNDAPKSFEEALHTYLAVGDIRLVSIEGLETYPYLDKVGGVSKREAAREAIRFSQETDRVYLNTNTVCTLRDPVLKRVISVHQMNSRSTIVWNPWIDKSARMADFGDDEWSGMVCIETANVGDQAVEIEPGQRHTMVTRIEVANAV